VYCIDVELAPQDQIARLANSFATGAPRQGGRPRKETSRRVTNAQPPARTPEQAQLHVKGQRGCKCGHCRVCIQNAEWDAKFNEKFGESMKDYYSGTRMTRQSSWWSEV
jgi:hypothetical protein